MTDYFHQIDFSVCKALGWKSRAQYSNGWVVVVDGQEMSWTVQTPKFCTNINLINNVVLTTLSYEQAEVYQDELYNIVQRDLAEQENPLPDNYAMITASAFQRTEALLRVLNAWPTEQPNLV